MTHAEFRRKQAEMDEAGMITHIRTIRTAKTKIGSKHNRPVFRYKYRYEVLVNGEIVKNTKRRITAKKFLIDWYESKKELELAQEKVNKVKARKLKEVAAV